jgi:CRP-like cAMP-binding protein
VFLFSKDLQILIEECVIIKLPDAVWIVFSAMINPKSNYLANINKLFKDGRHKLYPKNQLIHYAGDQLSNIYMVDSGYIKAYTILDSGDTRTILILGPGDIFPLSFSSTLDWQNYKIKYFYQTLCDSNLVTLSSIDLREHIDKDPEAMNTYMNYMAASNQAILSQLEVMKNKKAINKLEMILPYLIKKVGKQIKPHIYKLQIKLSHQEIADLSGVTRETTTTLVKELEKAGVIDQSKESWLINTKKLEELTSRK